MSNKPRMKHSDKLKKCCDCASLLPLLHRLKLYENGAHSETTMGQSKHTALVLHNAPSY